MSATTACMAPADWLRAVAVWSPFPAVPWQCPWTDDEVIGEFARFLPMRFGPDVFCEATVKLVASRCETFPNYYWFCKVLEGRS